MQPTLVSTPDPTQPIVTEVPPTLLPTLEQPTSTPTAEPILPTPEPTSGTVTPPPPMVYYTQSGDTLPSVAFRFGVTTAEITSPQEVPPTGLIQPGTLLVIPNVLKDTGPGEIAMPDSEVVFSPSALDFDTKSFVNDAGGYLSTYREYLVTGWQTGAEIIDRVAIENSINPRLLLAILEYKSHWVYGNPDSLSKIDYPMGNVDFNKKGLYQQLSWAVSQLSVGYYDWRAGLLNDVALSDGEKIRMAPGLNAGTAALQNVFSKIIDDRGRWVESLYGDKSLPQLYKRMFGDPWARAQTVEPLYPPNLTQPVLELPFMQGRTWSFTGGPHSAWGPDGARAALDFAPPSSISGCTVSEDWVTAAAPGQVVRSEGGQVVVDMDGDGREQTGWDMLYLHIASRDRIPVGSVVNTGDRLGHPSCEGGIVTGTHVHIARKYNGEWILADGALPFDLSGWIAHASDKIYIGTLTKGDQVVVASAMGSHESLIQHQAENP
jgi:LasA protease